MNKEKVLELADIIEQGHEGMRFDMEHFWVHNECGTAACIAGWAVFAFHDRQASEINPDDVPYIASEVLELNNRERDLLFFGGAYPMSVIKKEHAVAVLRRFAETGEIAWEEVMEKAPEDYTLEDILAARGY